ncbi:hypothetical protein QNN00_04105 [Bacillus velezensis]|nr:hypothetical protein [Bacillus velezensis]
MDIESQEILENSLMQFQGTIICVSHDRNLLEKFNKIFWLENQNVTIFSGPYSYAKQKNGRLPNKRGMDMTIDRLTINELSYDLFVSEYADKKPFILTGQWITGNAGRGRLNTLTNTMGTEWSPSGNQISKGSKRLNK